MSYYHEIELIVRLYIRIKVTAIIVDLRYYLVTVIRQQKRFNWGKRPIKKSKFDFSSNVVIHSRGRAGNKYGTNCER